MDSADRLVLGIVMVISTMWMVDRYWGTFYEKKKVNAMSVFSWSAYVICQIVFEWNSGNANIWLFFLNMFLVFMIAVTGYESRGKEKYYLLFLFIAVTTLIEIFVCFAGSLLLAEKALSNMVGSILSKIFSVIFVSVIFVVWNKKRCRFIEVKHLFLLLLIPIGSSYIAIAEFYSEISIYQSMVTMCFLLIFNVVIFEIYTKLCIACSTDREKNMYIQQLEFISRNTEEQKKMMEDFQEQKHNLVNELVAIRGELTDCNQEAARNSLNKIISNYDMSDAVSNSGNDVIDAILNFKYAVAKEKEIEFHVKACVPTELPIEQCDIGVVLGNALDNAIEAIDACSSEKWIDISIGVKKEAFVIHIKNPYEHMLKKSQGGTYISTKEETYQHGFGLKSIKRIAEKYWGDVVIDTDNHIFSLLVIMNFQ